VYIKDPLEETPDVPYPDIRPGVPRARELHRYHISVRIQSFEDGSTAEKNLECSLFVVKGNPLMVSPSPLPCFASGTNSFVIEIRSGDDLSGLYVQAIIPTFSAHMGMPLDELLEYDKSRVPVERSMTMWDTQTGKLRGTALIAISTEREEPRSYPEVLAARKTQPNHASATVSIASTPTIEASDEAAVEDSSSPLSYFTGGADLMAAARTWIGPWEGLMGEKKALEEETEKLEDRRKRSQIQGFSVA
jgi:hypothetical protein